jgi:hypothetical protein
MIPYITVTIVLFLLAGAAGGLVASSIPFFKTFDEFSRARLGPWESELIPAIMCTHVEHTAFWLGCFIAACGLFSVLWL